MQVLLAMLIYNDLPILYTNVAAQVEQLVCVVL